MKAIFHDEEDGNPEPTAGLPEALPDGENVLWRGKPDGFAFAFQALRIRFIAAYFAIFTLWRIAAIAAREGAASEMAGVIGVSALSAALGGGLLLALGWLMARSTIYTITNKRVILRYGVAIRKYVNVPFTVIEAVALKRHGGASGSIALATAKAGRIGYLHLWPHARPWRYGSPEPMLRALTEYESAARMLCEAIQKNAPAQVTVTLDRPPAAKPAEPVGATAPAPA